MVIDLDDIKQKAVAAFLARLDLELTPSYLIKPRSFRDGDQWCALLGDNIQQGVTGFGVSTELAYASFDTEWVKVEGSRRDNYASVKEQCAPQNDVTKKQDSKVIEGRCYCTALGCGGHRFYEKTSGRVGRHFVCINCGTVFDGDPQ